MTTRGILLAAIAGALLLAACGGSSAAPESAPANGAAGVDPMNPCAGEPDPRAFGGDDIVLDCSLALELANARLGFLHWPLNSIAFHRSMCPPNARCARVLHQGWVIYEFWSGEPVMIPVGPVSIGDVMTNEFVAGEPEPLPDWLLEIRATASRS